MSRTVSTAVQAAIASPTYRPVYFWRGDFDAGYERACTAPFSIWFDDLGTGTANEFVGTGTLGSVSAIQEGSQLQSYGMSATLSGVDPAQLSVALNSQYQGRNSNIWLAFLDTNHRLIDTLGDGPVLVFSGLMDTMPVEIGNTATITVNLENELARWENANPVNERYTDADQRAVYKTDRFFEFASNSASKELIWGRS